MRDIDALRNAVNGDECLPLVLSDDGDGQRLREHAELAGRRLDVDVRDLHLLLGRGVPDVEEVRLDRLSELLTVQDRQEGPMYAQMYLDALLSAIEDLVSEPSDDAARPAPERRTCSGRTDSSHRGDWARVGRR